MWALGHDIIPMNFWSQRLLRNISWLNGSQQVNQVTLSHRDGDFSTPLKLLILDIAILANVLPAIFAYSLYSLVEVLDTHLQELTRE